MSSSLPDMSRPRACGASGWDRHRRSNSFFASLSHTTGQGFSKHRGDVQGHDQTESPCGLPVRKWHAPLDFWRLVVLYLWSYIFMAITKLPWPPFLFISDFFLGIISDQVKPSWIDVFLYAESDKTHMTVGKNASLASYGQRTVFRWSCDQCLAKRKKMLHFSG